MKYVTVKSYLVGGICGHLWMPGIMNGKTISENLRQPIWGIYPKEKDPLSFRDVLLSYLCKEGRDFQDAEFTEDSSIVVERVATIKAKKNGGFSASHVFQRKISELWDCQDLVNPDYLSSDFDLDFE